MTTFDPVEHMRQAEREAPALPCIGGPLDGMELKATAPTMKFWIYPPGQAQPLYEQRDRVVGGRHGRVLVHIGFS